jgi:hypothetical protein
MAARVAVDQRAIGVPAQLEQPPRLRVMVLLAAAGEVGCGRGASIGRSLVVELHDVV